MVIDAFCFDIDTTDEKTINELVQMYFDVNTKPGVLKFTYKKTPEGYEYNIGRYCPYAYTGGWILDLDSALVCGLPLDKFQIDLLHPEKVPLTFCVPGNNTQGYYAPVREIAKVYKKMISAGEDAAEPCKVTLYACDTEVCLKVKYK